MKYLKIKNKGELDIRLFYLMGGTTKDNDSSKIGQWGSGLKYIISFLLRNEITFKVFVGVTPIEITTQSEVVRGETFQIIWVNDVKTSLVTKMGGSAWNEWTCLREIYSNALDEGEASIGFDDTLVGEEGKTTFFIEATPEFIKIFNNWDDYFLERKIPMYENDKFKLYPNGGGLRLYKQGVLIGTHSSPSLFLYDFKDAQINELREYKGSFGNDLASILYSIDCVKTIQYIIKNITDEMFEGKIDYKFWRSETWQKPNNAWKEAFGNAKIITQKVKDKILNTQANVELTHTVVLPEALYKGLNHHISDISALRLADKVNEFYEIIDEHLMYRLKQCVKWLEGKDYICNPEITFIIGEFGNQGTLAKVNIDTKEIMISQRLNTYSDFDICKVLIEENEHIITGFHDETRAFQNHFINLYAAKLLL